MRDNVMIADWIDDLSQVSPRTKTVFKVLAVLGGAWAIAASAQWRVDLMPFSPVPITAQSLVVLLIGWFYGRTLAVSTVGAYLVFGAFGVPVFASKSAGLSWLTGATGGYLIGFLLAAYVLASSKVWFRTKIKNIVVADLSLLLLGKAIILSLGVLWLSQLMGFSAAITAGLVPFLPGMIVKMAAAFAVIRFFERKG